MDKRMEEAMRKRKIAENKATKVGNLGLTADDHNALGSTIPDQRLVDSPGKTLAELMNDPEITEWLGKIEDSVRTFQKPCPYPGKEMQWKEHLKRKEESMEVALNYLIKIGRLPEKFKDFDIDTIEPEE